MELQINPCPPPASPRVLCLARDGSCPRVSMCVSTAPDLSLLCLNSVPWKRCANKKNQNSNQNPSLCQEKKWAWPPANPAAHATQNPLQPLDASILQGHRGGENRANTKTQRATQSGQPPGGSWPMPEQLKPRLKYVHLRKQALSGQGHASCPQTWIED